MTVTLTKPYVLDLTDKQFVVLLRRYDVSDAPWGVHIVTCDLTNNSMWVGLLGSRPVGLFSTDAVRQLIRANRLDAYFPGANGLDALWEDVYATTPGFDPLAHQLYELTRNYIWRQVVPMEWHGKRLELQDRVITLSRFPAFDGDDYWWDGEDLAHYFLNHWDRAAETVA